MNPSLRTKLMKMLIVRLMALALLGAASPLLAWNKAGHMLTAAIAYQELVKTNRFDVIQTVITELSKMPDDLKAKYWQPGLNNVLPEERDQYLFALAARWPDDVRKTWEDREKWHYINFPFKPPGTSESVHTKAPDPNNILRAFKRNWSVLRQSSASDAQRAKALCWIFHLTGDVHQPLHSTALFTAQFSDGDRGGTLFYIRRDQDTGPQHLHSFWDGLVHDSEEIASVTNRASELRNRPTLSRSALSAVLSEKAFNQWAETESFALAKFAYKDGALLGSKSHRGGEKLPDGYQDTMQPIAEQRAVLAGYRLADMLVSIFGGIE